MSQISFPFGEIDHPITRTDFWFQENSAKLQLFAKLNRAGRGKFKRSAAPSRAEFLKLVALASNDLDVLFSLVLLKPVVLDRQKWGR